ncbi:MAG TPA: imidazole glycerol phosphate synthase subunit HisH [Saprospiraceae bacterium]|nr:imidazole glycerol phosphate synthase subunit HisH [Saprospiraceae bacterium]
MTAIVDYGAGNTKSVTNLLDRLGQQYVLTADENEIRKADRLILPGVGHAASAMESLKKSGLIPTLKTYQKPFLGICLGMQLMYDFSEEGEVDCLGIIPGCVKKFESDGKIKVPHMGWNTIQTDIDNPLFENIPNHSYVYFVHSYFAAISKETIASCDYIFPFSAAVQYRNFFAVQFHPEKSGAVGQKMMENFCRF